MSPAVEKLLLILGRLISTGIFLAAVVLFCRSLVLRRSVGDVLGTFLFISLPLAAVGGLLFYRFFICHWVDNAVTGFLWTRARLKKSPLPLSPFYGRLNNGQYLAVWQEMRELPGKEFRDPEVVQLFAQACMNLPEHAGEGVAAMETFFRNVRRTEGHSAEVLSLFLYYADTALICRTPAEISAVLEKALKDCRFAGHEKTALLARLSVLKEMGEK